MGGATKIMREPYSETRTISDYTHVVQCYDPSLNSWSILGNFITDSYNIKMCNWDGNMLATGGTHRSNLTNKIVYIYEPDNDKWEEMGSLENISKYLFTASKDTFID